MAATSVAATAALATTTASALRRGIEIIIAAGLARLAGKGKGGEQATHLLAVTSGTYNIIGVLMTDQ